MDKVKKARRILLSMRDVAAAHFILPLFEFLQDSGKYEVKIVAQDPAASILIDKGVEFLFLDSEPLIINEGRDIDKFLSKASYLVCGFKPELIVVGLSSHGGGVDEALVKLKLAPTVLIQDFWGAVNVFFGEKPDYVFTLDKVATDLTRKGYDIPCIEVGSLRHFAYRDLNPWNMRENFRRRLSFFDGAVAGWFGQSLHNYPGYRDTIRCWAQAVKELSESCDGERPRHFVYKPHPLETRQDIDATNNILRVLGDVEVLENVSIEDALCLCDSVSSIMSNCLYDAAYINKIAAEPFITPLSVLVSEELLKELGETIDFAALPYEKSGIASVVKDDRNLLYQLKMAHEEEQKLLCLEASRASLCGLEGVLEKVVAQLDRLLFKS